MTKIVNSWNEWDPLKRVIVGRPDGTVVAAPEPAAIYDLPHGGFPAGKYGPLPDEQIQKAREEMNGFCEIFEKSGVIVERAIPINFNQKVSTPDWVNETMRGCMPPRDILLPIGNEILEATMSERSRWYEYLCYRPILEQYFKEDPDFIWSAAPKPRLTDESYVKDYYHNFNNLWTNEEKEKRMLERNWHLTDKEPLFDAADIARCGKDIFIQASCKTNAPGISWLKRHFEPKGFRVHVVQFGGNPHLWHIDANYLPLCPGKAMINPDWPPISEEFVKLHKINDWELIPAARPVRDVNHPLSYCGPLTRAPMWLSINTFMLDPKTVFVEAGETSYQEQFDKLGFEVIAIPFWQVSPFGGAFHCATVDVYREGECEDYFPKQIPGF